MHRSVGDKSVRHCITTCSFPFCTVSRKEAKGKTVHRRLEKYSAPAGKLYQGNGVLGRRSEGLTYMLALFTLQKRETTRRKKCERIPALHAKARSEEFERMADVTIRQSQRGKLLLDGIWSIRARFEKKLFAATFLTGPPWTPEVGGSL